MKKTFSVGISLILKGMKKDVKYTFKCILNKANKNWMEAMRYYSLQM